MEIAGALQAAMERAVAKVRQSLSLPGFPHVGEGAAWQTTPDGAWTGGFWVGLAWLAWDETRDPVFREAAERGLERLMPRAGEVHNHDLGMMFGPSAVLGFRLTGVPRYREVAVTAARSLAAQLHPQGGFIPGWGFFGQADWAGRALVDTLMNLPLLTWAAREGAAPALREAAMIHARTSIRHHLRQDGSTYHVYRFDPESGRPLGPDTYQGRAADSCWSRGQSWAVAGLALLWEMTGEGWLGEAARRAGDYLAARLAETPLPPWDYADPDPHAPPDSAAAAIGAYGLARLARLTGDAAHWKVAEGTVRHLVETCLAPPEHPAILRHATADRPHGIAVDGFTVYGDFFFVKALRALRNGAVGHHPDREVLLP